MGLECVARSHAMIAIGFALASLAFAAALEVTYKRYAARERSRGMFVAGIGVVWGTMQALLWLQQARPLSWDITSVSFALAAGIAVAASNLLLIESLTHMDVSLGSTVYRLNTVVVVALSFVFLAESVGGMKLLAIGFGVAAALVGAAVAGGAGGLVGATLSGFIDSHHAHYLQEQLDRGGLLLWVRTPDALHEHRAVDILKRHSAEDVHVHDLPDLAFEVKGGVSHDTSFMNRLRM